MCVGLARIKVKVVKFKIDNMTISQLISAVWNQIRICSALKYSFPGLQKIELGVEVKSTAKARQYIQVGPVKVQAKS